MAALRSRWLPVTALGLSLTGDTGGAAGYGNTVISAGYAAFPQSFQPDAPIILTQAALLYSYLNGQGVLRPYQQGTDDVSHAAISN